ncbi:MAG: putative aliphatic sulfonates-binding protein precursor [Syntrophorhabdaceae bacterium PtaU1.Bin034]|nr:MAG: putative aliphatic sulfonates-binding protein precursor [Syntrophorhabdaceae bacterium PtaU1.Bin034]
MHTVLRSLLLFFLFTIVAFPHNVSAKTPRLKVGYSAGGGSILTFIAQDQKFFQKEGIEVELIPFTSSADGLNALNSGKIDIGISFGTAGPLTFITKGSDFLIIGGHLSGGHPVITLPAKASQFKTIQDYKGKKVGTPRIYTADVVWRGAMKRAGFNLEKDVEIIEMKNPPALLEAVKAGRVDVGIGASSLYMKAKQAKLAIVGWSNDFQPDHPCCRAVAKGKAVKNDPETYKAFLRALIQAEKIRYAKPELAVDINRRFLEIDEDMARDYTLEPHQSHHADPNRKGVIDMWEDMNAVGYIKSDIDIDRHINIDLYRAALDELIKKNPGDKFYGELKKRFAQQNL